MPSVESKSYYSDLKTLFEKTFPKASTEKISIGLPSPPIKTQCSPRMKIERRISSESANRPVSNSGDRNAGRKPVRVYVPCRRCPWTTDHVSIDCKRKICPTCRAVDVDKYHIAQCAAEERKRKSTECYLCVRCRRLDRKYKPY